MITALSSTQGVFEGGAWHLAFPRFAQMLRECVPGPLLGGLQLSCIDLTPSAHGQQLANRGAGKVRRKGEQRGATNATEGFVHGEFRNVNILLNRIARHMTMCSSCRRLWTGAGRMERRRYREAMLRRLVQRQAGVKVGNLSHRGMTKIMVFMFMRPLPLFVL